MKWKFLASLEMQLCYVIFFFFFGNCLMKGCLAEANK